MNKFRKIEIGLISLFLLLTILQLNEISVLWVLLLSLLALDIHWIYALFQSKKINSIGFIRKNIIEKILISVLLFGISLSISFVAYSSLLVKLGLLILTFYYLINGIIRLVKEKQDWFSALERIILSLILFGFFLRFMLYPGASALRIFPLLILFILMIVYSFISINKFNKDNHSLRIYTMLVYWSISLGIIFLLFAVMFWPGKIAIFIFYAFSMALITILYFVKYFSIDKSSLSDSASDLLYQTTRRIFIYNCICLFMVFTSRRQFDRMTFGNRPQLIDAIINCRTSTAENENKAACIEANRLDSLWRAGQYPEEL